MRRLGLAALLLALPAAAQELGRHAPAVLRPGIGEADPRQPVPVAEAPWRALGRVQTELGGRCTGALIAPDQVLTAAHCLLGPRTGAYVRPGSVHFLLGYDRGAFVAAARARGFETGPDFAPGRGPAAADWAVITLERPVAEAARTLPLLRTPPAPRTPAMLGGYQQDRPEALLADTGCRILGRHAGGPGAGALVHDCAGTRGSSGAPLLAPRPDGRGWGIAGVQSAVAADVALGVAAPAGALPARAGARMP